jgi:hypothetical protein
MLWAKPTRVGESLWIWLRPGLARENLLERLDQIAVACWADKVTIERASATNAALVRVDISRRDALTGTVASPLPTDLPGDLPGELPTDVDGIDRRFTIGGDAAADTTAGLDITDINEEHVTDSAGTTDAAASKKNGTRTRKATVPAADDDDPFADYR